MGVIATIVSLRGSQSPGGFLNEKFLSVLKVNDTYYIYICNYIYIYICKVQLKVQTVRGGQHGAAQ